MSMHKLKSSTASAKALVGIWTVSVAAFIIATLYLARALLIPLALAALLTFLLAPLVTRLERWLGRIGAMLLVVTLILAVTGAAGWVLTRQLVDLATKLPDYKENIQTKLRSFKVPTGGTFTKFSETVEELKKDLPGAQAPDITQVPGKPETAVLKDPSTRPAVPAQAIETSKTNPFQLVQVIVAPLLGPLGTGALVLLLVIFMMLKGEDLRSRLIRVIGQDRISASTRAMDDGLRRNRRGFGAWCPDRSKRRVCRQYAGTFEDFWRHRRDVSRFWLLSVRDPGLAAHDEPVCPGPGVRHRPRFFARGPHPAAHFFRHEPDSAGIRPCRVSGVSVSGL
jgi:predicted PurR-regulated permease PerM